MFGSLDRWNHTGHLRLNFFASNLIYADCSRVANNGIVVELQQFIKIRNHQKLQITKIVDHLNRFTRPAAFRIARRLWPMN